MIGRKLPFTDETFLGKHYMNKRILILTDQESNIKGTFVWQHIENLKDINDSILEKGIEKELSLIHI